MTGPAQPAGTGLGRCFEVFTVSAFRLETLRAYAAPGEENRLRAFRRGLPLPERPAETSRWLRRITATTAAGKSWHRVRVLDRPLSEEECYRLLGYRESAEADEVIRIADRSACPALATLARDFEPVRDPTRVVHHGHAEKIVEHVVGMTQFAWASLAG